MRYMGFLLIVLVTDLFKNVFGLRRRYESNVQIDGKVVVITGANTGIGKETAYQLYRRGAKIILGCRDLEKGENAIKDIKHKYQTRSISNLFLVKLDLSSLSSVRQFAKQVSEMFMSIDILINNAGVFISPERQTEDGFEKQFGTNHLGSFLLTLSLMPLLKKSTKARVINVTSSLHLIGKIHFENLNLKNMSYNPFRSYSQSKLATILFTRELAKRLETNVNIYSLHPGIIDSDMGRNITFFNFLKIFSKLFFIDCQMGAQTTLYCALEESLDNESGHYYDDCKRNDKMIKRAIDDNDAQKLWEMSEEMVKLEDHLRL